MTETSGRDRLRELLDAVLDEEHHSLTDMAGGAYSSPYHFTPTAQPRGRRAAGRDATPGDARAGGVAAAARRLGDRRGVRGRLRVGRGVQPCLLPRLRPPAEPARRVHGEPQHWLPAPNGIHFHPPTSLWVHTGERTMSQPIDQLIHHDLDDTRELLDLAKQLPESAYRAQVRPGQQVLCFDGPGRVGRRRPHPPGRHQGDLAGRDRGRRTSRRPDPTTPPGCSTGTTRSPAAGSSMVRDIERRDAWDDRIIDALCDPPESFVLGSILAHVLSFGAARRQLARTMLRDARADRRRRRPDHLAAPSGTGQDT